MGNSQSSSTSSSSSSSQFPRRREEDRSPGNSSTKKPMEEEKKDDSSISTAVMLGVEVMLSAAVAGTTLRANGACKFSIDVETGRRQTAKGSGGGGFGYAQSGDYNHYTDHHKSYKHHLKESTNHVSGTIKVMSYNVGFNELLYLQERIAAIGRLVQQHEPDVIFIQEVTPKIYDIFRKSNWWTEYVCSIASEEATKRNFCMLLTKLPAKRFFFHAFPNSTMGRVLCAAEVEVGMGQNLIVATSHLESPTPPDMHSMQRVAQAKMALKLLRNAPNVIFGGDMNWDEHSDGPFPQAEGWADAWRQLRAGEEGWTYDTKVEPYAVGQWPNAEKT